MSLLHPLAESVPYLINCRDQASIDFDDPQPVFLDGNIYMKGKCDPDGRNLRLWKYSIQSNIFSELMFPETCRSVTEDDCHILTSFRSQVLLVHAQITHPHPLPEPIYIDGRLDYELTYGEYEGEENLDVRQRTHRLNLRFHKPLKDNVWEGSASYTLKSPDPLSIVDPMYAVDRHYSEFEEHYYTEVMRIVLVILCTGMSQLPVVMIIC